MRENVGHMLNQIPIDIEAFCFSDMAVSASPYDQMNAVSAISILCLPTDTYRPRTL